MSLPCTTCQHGRRHEIDEALLSGEPRRRVATRFQLPEANVRRHASHVRGAIRVARQAAEHARVLDVTMLLASINSAALDALRQARGDGDVRAVAIVCNALLKQLEFSHQLDIETSAAEMWSRIEALERLVTPTSGEVIRSWRNHSAN